MACAAAANQGCASHDSCTGETMPGWSKPRPGAKGTASRPLQYQASTSAQLRGSGPACRISVRTRIPGSQGRIS